MAETAYVGAYWGARPESAAVCADRLAGFLGALSGIDPLMASWFKKGSTRRAEKASKVDPTPDALRGLLLSGRALRDDSARSVMSDLGFLVCWFLERPEPASGAHGKVWSSIADDRVQQQRGARSS